MSNFNARQIAHARPKPPNTLRIVSWNVNGLRACTKKGFVRFLNACDADIVGIQELRALPDQLDDAVRKPKGWHAVFQPAERKGYSGVAIFSRQPPDSQETDLGIAEYDVEGRLLIARFGRMSVVTAYFPKGSGKDRDNSRVPYKLGFYQALFDRVQQLRRSGPVFVMGDYNTAHQEIDLARPKTNEKSSGFLPEEREELSRWLAAGWVDTFRQMHGDLPDQYTWWRQWGNARADNVGWRIDYVLASKSASKRVVDAFIWHKALGSDHCPVGVDIRL